MRKCGNRAAVIIPGKGHFCTDHYPTVLVESDIPASRLIWHDGCGNRACGQIVHEATDTKGA